MRKDTKKSNTNKKRARYNDEHEIIDGEKHLTSKKFSSQMDISSDSDYESASDESEEGIYVDDNHSDRSDEYMEEDVNTESKNVNINSTQIQQSNVVNIWDEKDKSKLKENEELDFDNEAYEMLHRSKVEWPCMSLDFVVPENFKAPFDFNKKNALPVPHSYPLSCYLVAGSQTTSPNGYLYYMKWYNMHSTKFDEDPDKEPDSDEEEGQEPYLKYERCQIKGNVNRLKTMKNSYLAGFWSDSPSVEIVDLSELINDLELSSAMAKENLESGIGNKENNFGNKKRKLGAKNITLKSFNRNYEGFGIEWSPLIPGVLAAGGQDKKIEVYLPKDETFSDWVLNSNNINNTFGTLKGHTASVEDIIWSPSQAHVLASCSVDKSIRFWDLRVDKANAPVVIENAHESDVNCISWNTYCDFMIASGGDDKSFKVWDIRYISNGPISNIRWHRGPITALAWDPYEDSQIVVSSEDDRVSVWDFAVEPDDKHLFDAYNQEVPQQLIFLHQGQENIKDVKFHPYYKNLIVSTAENGINLFKPAFDDDSYASNDEDNGDMHIDDN